MRRIDTAVPDVCVLEPDIFRDERGFFFESFHREKMARLGITESFVQDNHSRSVRGTLRGLHYQLRHPQAKLCRVVRGAVLDVAVDLRHGSPTFGTSVTALLTEENHHQVYVPAGFAHGFLVLTESADFLYKCSDFYRRDDEHGIAWDDPDLAIEWELARHGIDVPIVSAKDARNPRLAQVDRSHLPDWAAPVSRP